MKIDTDTSRKDPIKDPKIEFRTRKRPEKKRKLVASSFLEYIKLDRDKSTFKSHRDFSSEKEISFKHF